MFARVSRQSLNSALAQDCTVACTKVQHTPDANITWLRAPQKDQSGNFILGTGNAFWGDTSTLEGTPTGTKREMGTFYTPGAPENEWVIGIFNTGKFAADHLTILDEPTKESAGWPIKNVTKWDPGLPWAKKQLSSHNNYPLYSNHSAIQASGNAWGGYLNSDDWMNNGQNMTIRYGYRFPTGPRPFKQSLYGTKTAVLVEANLAVSTYTGTRETTTATTAPIGYAVMNVTFRDTKNAKFFVFVGHIFDWRGFTTKKDGGIKFPKTGTFKDRIGGGLNCEGASVVGTGEMTVGSHLGSGTNLLEKYAGSAFSTTETSDVKKYFAYKISRKNFRKMLLAANNVIASDPDLEGVKKYSTNLDDYIIREVNVGIEMARLSTDPSKKIEMSYQGDSFKISTLHN